MGHQPVWFLQMNIEPRGQIYRTQECKRVFNEKDFFKTMPSCFFKGAHLYLLLAHYPNSSTFYVGYLPSLMRSSALLEENIINNIMFLSSMLCSFFKYFLYLNLHIHLLAPWTLGLSCLRVPKWLTQGSKHSVPWSTVTVVRHVTWTVQSG